MKRKRPKVPKERNPFVAQAMFRKAGAHEKTTKAKRAEDKRVVAAYKKFSGSADTDPLQRTGS